MKVKRIPLPRGRFWAALSLAALCLGMLSLTPSAALASTQLTAPADLRALHVADTSADLFWSDDSLSDGDVLQLLVNGSWRQYPTAEPVFGYLHLANLMRGTTYTFRAYTPGTPDLDTTTSPPSAPMSFTTLPAPDSVPPAQPSGLLVGNTTTTLTTLQWSASTDNVQVTGYYVQELENGTWTTIATQPSYVLTDEPTGLTPATSYQFAVIAFDAQGNQSARSGPATVTTLAATQFPGCRFQLTSYNPGFTAYATIINTTAGPLSNWSVSLTMPANTSVGSVFGGTLARTATGGTLNPAAYDATIGPGGEAFIGFTGSVSPFNPPSGLTLNGQPCTSS
jgi:Cellulose binding domain/Fibronectin type III domain